MAAIVEAVADGPLQFASTITAGAGGDGTAAIELFVPANLKYFEGHFPGCAILPGVVQINWAIEFGRRHFSMPLKFKALANIKFMRVITPGSTVQLELEFSATRSELSFAYKSANATCSSGTVCFGD